MASPLVYIFLVLGCGIFALIFFPYIFTIASLGFQNFENAPAIHPTEEVTDYQKFALNSNIAIGREFIINITKYNPFPPNFQYTKSLYNESFSPILHNFAMQMWVMNNMDIPIKLNATQFNVYSSFATTTAPVEQPVKLVNPNTGQQDSIDIAPYKKVPVILTTKVYGVRDFNLMIKLQGFSTIIALPTPY